MTEFMQIDWNGDRWDVIGAGVTDDQGRVYCHLASVTRFRQQKNGNCPIQASDWIPENMFDLCLDCDGKCRYPSGKLCLSCGGIGRVPAGSNSGVIAY